MKNLARMTDEELDAHRIAVLTEQERRANRAAIPAQVRALRDAYEAGGGDRADLAAALEEPAEEVTP